MWRSPLILAFAAIFALPAFAALNDLDNDGIADAQDPDRDGDGLSNFLESAAGFDPDVADQVDTDGDGIPNSIDDDIDGDGVPNQNDAFPLNKRDWIDTDADGVGDNSDKDLDGDGIANDYEE
ncbi:MAG: thrombospondin type 3 repeat-containing protein, partial [Alcanivorax sp.]